MLAPLVTVLGQRPEGVTQAGDRVLSENSELRPGLGGVIPRARTPTRRQLRRPLPAPRRDQLGSGSRMIQGPTSFSKRRCLSREPGRVPGPRAGTAGARSPCAAELAGAPLPRRDRRISRRDRTVAGGTRSAPSGPQGDRRGCFGPLGSGTAVLTGSLGAGAASRPVRLLGRQGVGWEESRAWAFCNDG